MFNIYKDEAGQWRWRLVDTKGNIVAESASSFRRRGAAVKAADAIRKLVATAGIVEQIA